MLFTAKEARKRVYGLENVIEYEKIMAESKIVTAVENKKHSCHLGWVEFETVEWLINLGYNIERVIDLKNGTDTIVTW